MAALLRYANYAKVARDLDVSRTTVMRWARGEAVTPWQLRRVRDLFGVNENDPLQPIRAEEVVDKLGQILANQETIIGALVPAERMAQAVELIGRLEALLPPPAESPHAEAPDTGRGAAGQPHPAGGSLPGRSLEG